MNGKIEFGAPLIFSLIGSLSILSIFVVLPYTIGFWLFIDIYLIGLFSISEYYIFSAYPILFAIVVAVTYAAVPYFFQIMAAVPPYNLILTKIENLFAQHLKSHKSQFFGGSFMGLSTFLLFAPLLIVIFSIGALVLFLPLFFLVLVVCLNHLLPVNRVVFLASAFLCLEMFLLASGYNNARNLIITRKKFEVTGAAGKNITGSLLFAGSGSLLFFDAEHRISIVKNDGTGLVRFGRVDSFPRRGCLDFQFLWTIRRYFNVTHCVLLSIDERFDL